MEKIQEMIGKERWKKLVHYYDLATIKINHFINDSKIGHFFHKIDHYITIRLSKKSITIEVDDSTISD